MNPSFPNSLEKYLLPFTGLRQGGTATGKARHKPVLLLALLEELESGTHLPEHQPIDAVLQHRFESIWRLLIPDTRPGDFFKPVYHLPNDRFWEVRTRTGQPAIKEYHSLKSAAADGLWGGFTGYYREIFVDPAVRELARMVLLDHYFPLTKQFYLAEYGQAGPILQAEADMQLREPEARYVRQLKVSQFEGFIRHWKFRHQILQLYAHTCCMSGLMVRKGSSFPLVEACHIEQHTLSGLDTPTNGLALCPNLHTAFDTGLIALTDDYRIILSRDFQEADSVYSLRPLAGLLIRLPADARFHPDPKRLAGHRERWGISARGYSNPF